MFPDMARRWLYRHRQANRLARFLNTAQARQPRPVSGRNGWSRLKSPDAAAAGRSRFPRSSPTTKRPVHGFHARRGHQLGTQRPRVRGTRRAPPRCAEPVMLREVGVDHRAPILRCYLQRAGGPEPTSRRLPGASRSVRADRGTLPGVPHNSGEGNREPVTPIIEHVPELGVREKQRAGGNPSPACRAWAWRRASRRLWPGRRRAGRRPLSPLPSRVPGPQAPGRPLFAGAP